MHNHSQVTRETCTVEQDKVTYSSAMVQDNKKVLSPLANKKLRILLAKLKDQRPLWLTCRQTWSQQLLCICTFLRENLHLMNLDVKKYNRIPHFSCVPCFCTSKHQVTITMISHCMECVASPEFSHSTNCTDIST
jgi:hypothetical protein